jgi:hypothetical protein
MSHYHYLNDRKKRGMSITFYEHIKQQCASLMNFDDFLTLLWKHALWKFFVCLQSFFSLPPAPQSVSKMLIQKYRNEGERERETNFFYTYGHKFNKFSLSLCRRWDLLGIARGINNCEYARAKGVKWNVCGKLIFTSFTHKTMWMIRNY